LAALLWHNSLKGRERMRKAAKETLHVPWFDEWPHASSSNTNTGAHLLGSCLCHWHLGLLNKFIRLGVCLHSVNDKGIIVLVWKCVVHHVHSVCRLRYAESGDAAESTLRVVLIDVYVNQLQLPR